MKELWIEIEGQSEADVYANHVSFSSELYCLVVGLRIDERSTHPGGSSLIRGEKSISKNWQPFYESLCYCLWTWWGDESRGTESAKSLNTDILDIKHFSLLGADKRPDNLTLTTDTTRHSKKHGDRSTWREQCALCASVHVYLGARHSAQVLILHSGEPAIAWGWTVCLIKWHRP